MPQPATTQNGSNHDNAPMPPVDLAALSGQLPAPLPALNWKDRLKNFETDLKFRWCAARLYYKWRSEKKAKGVFPELKLLEFLVDRTKTAVDVGANRGMVTYFLAKYATHVYAVEPSPVPLRVLPYVLDKNVTLLPIALSDHNGEVALNIARLAGGYTSNGASLEHTEQKEQHIDLLKHKVPVFRLDDLSLGDIGFLKIDVEGHEHAVIRGAEKTISKCRPVIMIENEIRHIEHKVQEIFESLFAKGYRGYALINGALTSVKEFDFGTGQKTDFVNTKFGYVKDFIFLPE